MQLLIQSISLGCLLPDNTYMSFGKLPSFNNDPADQLFFWFHSKQVTGTMAICGDENGVTKLGKF